jgi:antitoxin component YwqK of YwqJK toxin-antitoxin module
MALNANNMKYKLILVSLMINMISFSQNESLFSKLYEIQNEYIKIYLDEVYKVEYKQCAKYYMLCKIDRQKLEFTDSVFVFDMKDRIRSKCYFQSSKLHGKFVSYFQDGQIEITGEYTEGIRTGEWKYYYSNSQLKKIIDFGTGIYFPLLKEFYIKNGKRKVSNGNGDFKDLMASSISSTRLMKYRGNVTNGLLSGKWIVEDNGSIICKEEYDNGELIQGISFSIESGEQEYLDKPISTIFEINYLEYVKIFGPSHCNGETELGLSLDFLDKLHGMLVDRINDFNDSWYFVEIQTDKKGIFNNAIIYPNNELLQGLIRDNFKDKEIETVWPQARFGQEVIMIYFNDEVYFSGSQNSNNFILSFRY